MKPMTYVMNTYWITKNFEQLCFNVTENTIIDYRFT